MADDNLASTSQSGSRQAAKRRRLDTHCEDSSTSVPPAASLEAEMFVDSNHPSQVLEGLNRMWLDGVLCDVILCSQGQEFPCHRYLLASFSSYFQAMFTSGMVESTLDRVAIGGVEPEILGLLVNYAYTSKLSISTANVQALLTASNLLEFAGVRDACCDYMERYMDINNCLGIYCIAEVHSCNVLKEHSMDYILKHFSVIYRQEEFLSLSVERLTEILGSDHLDVPNEDMAFEAAMLWLNKSPTRKQSVEKVLEQIRLPLISPSYLHTVLKSLDVLKEYQCCQRFISEAKERLLVPYCNTARTRMSTVIVAVEDYNCKVKSFDPLTSQWKALGRLPVKLEGYAVVSSGSSLYMAGGKTECDCVPYDSCGSYSNEMWRYDVRHNSWSKMAPMNMARHRFSLVMLDGYVFAVGHDGIDDPFRKSADSIEKYDPKTSTWQLMEFVGVRERYDAVGRTVVGLGGHLYFVGNKVMARPTQPAKFNPETSEWTEIAAMQIPRYRSAACALNGKLYVIGGSRHKSPRGFTHGVAPHENRWGRYATNENTIECYCPETNQWTMCAPMNRARYSHYVVAAEGKIYVLGGVESYNEDSSSSGDDDDEDGDDDDNHHDYSSRRNLRASQNIECYCEKTDMWVTVGKMTTGSYQMTDRLNCVSLRLRSDHTYNLMKMDHYDVNALNV